MGVAVVVGDAPPAEASPFMTSPAGNFYWPITSPGSRYFGRLVRKIDVSAAD
jgi:hypothetical protein